MEQKKITVYTDGSARGNPGQGGYGVIMMFGNHRKEMSAGYRLTTNNRMELLAVITALKSITKNIYPVHIFTDSKYVADAIAKRWLDKWIATQFKGGKKNEDLWREYYSLSREFKITFHWVKGHGDNVFNNRCDELATSAADGYNLLIDEFYEIQMKKEN